MRSPAEVSAALERRDLLTAAFDCARVFHADPNEMLAGSHRPTAVRARERFWLALVRLGLSRSEVSRLFGSDPSTVSDAIRRAAARVESETSPCAESPSAK